MAMEIIRVCVSSARRGCINQRVIGDEGNYWLIADLCKEWRCHARAGGGGVGGGGGGGVDRLMEAAQNALFFWT